MSGDFDDQNRDQDFVVERRRGFDWRRLLIPAALIGAALLGLILILGLASLLRRDDDGTAGGADPTATPRVVVNTGTTTPRVGTTARTTPATTAAGTTTAVTTTTPAAAGRFFVVSGTDGEGVRLRDAPGGTQIGAYADGTRLEQIGQDQNLNGVTWRNVRGPDGQEGFVSTQFLTPAP